MGSKVNNPYSKDYFCPSIEGMKRILVYIWRVWFYITILIAIVLLFPFILITSQRASHYPSFFRLSRVWAWIVLVLSGFWPKVYWAERPEKGKLYIICPNHTSMIDIMLTLAIFPNCFLFIGKRELAKLPLFGYFYRKTNILVDRSSIMSSRRAFETAASKLQEGIGLCIFPEGGVPEESVQLARFKNGAFRLAVEHRVTIIPVSYPNNKAHLPYDYNRGYPGIIRAYVHPFLEPRDGGQEEINRLRSLCYDVVLSGLRYQSEEKLINEPG